MQHRFARRIAVHVQAELAKARRARSSGEPRKEFAHLERAHVLGQASTYWHVKVHGLMLAWGLRNRSIREVLGQIARIIGAATATAFGWVPAGNTGGANVSAFRKMPIPPDLAALIQQAKSPPTGQTPTSGRLPPDH